MHLANEARKALRRIALGDTDLPQQCTAALQDPQTEVRVWLHGLGIASRHYGTPYCGVCFPIDNRNRFRIQHPAEPEQPLVSSLS